MRNNTLLIWITPIDRNNSCGSRDKIASEMEVGGKRRDRSRSPSCTSFCNGRHSARTRFFRWQRKCGW